MCQFITVCKISQFLPVQLAEHTYRLICQFYHRAQDSLVFTSVVGGSYLKINMSVISQCARFASFYQCSWRIIPIEQINMSVISQCARLASFYQCVVGRTYLQINMSVITVRKILQFLTVCSWRNIPIQINMSVLGSMALDPMSWNGYTVLFCTEQ